MVNSKNQWQNLWIVIDIDIAILIAIVIDIELSLQRLIGVLNANLAEIIPIELRTGNAV